MTEALIAILALICGTLLGWYLRSKSVPENNSAELDQLRDRLMEAEKRETAATTRVEESQKRIEVEKSRLEEIRKEMKNTFKALAADIAKGNSAEFLKMAGEKFHSLKVTSEKHLDEKKKLIDQNLEGMNKKLETITRQSTELKTSIEESKTETEKLRDTTGKLREVLSSSQRRGQWGERMIEDILNIMGLQENINYKRQKQVESGQRPDFTFILPKGKIINLDVKFPWASYKEFIETDDEQIRKTMKTEFLKRVKEHIKTLSGREYVNPAEGTLDYVMMFIPNESIYGFIHKEDKDMVDFALEKKVLLCSPLTLYAILSLIHQATRNFHMEEKAAEVLNLVETFRKHWSKYGEVMKTLGNSIDSVNRNFDLLKTTRSNQLEKPMNKISEIAQGTIHLQLEEVNE